MLLTASSLFVVVALFSAAFAHRHAIICMRAASELEGMRARVIANDAAIDALDSRLRKLSGHYYRSGAHKEPLDPRPEFASEQPRRIPDAVCENWQTAQVEGPKSPAALCECRYCLEMRTRRAREKAAILAERSRPKSANDVQ